MGEEALTVVSSWFLWCVRVVGRVKGRWGQEGLGWDRGRGTHAYHGTEETGEGDATYWTDPRAGEVYSTTWLYEEED